MNVSGEKEIQRLQTENDTLFSQVKDKDVSRCQFNQKNTIFSLQNKIKSLEGTKNTTEEDPLLEELRQERNALKTKLEFYDETLKKY